MKASLHPLIQDGADILRRDQVKRVPRPLGVVEEVDIGILQHLLSGQSLKAGGLIVEEANARDGFSSHSVQTAQSGEMKFWEVSTY